MYRRTRKSKKQRKVQSPFVKYCTTTISCILVASTCFVFLVFGTDSVYSPEDITLGKTLTFQRTSMQSVSDSLSNGNIISSGGSDGTIGDIPTPGLDLSGTGYEVYNQAVYDCFKDTKFSSRAYTYARAYPYLCNRYSRNVAIGIMANMFAEGYAGIVQGGKRLVNWNGDSSTIKTNYSNPTIVSNTANLDFILELYESKNKGANGNSRDIGFGCVQWTWWEYLKPLSECYRKYCTTFSDEELMTAELAMLDWSLSVYYNAKFDKLMNKHINSSAEDVAEVWLIEYERPGNAKKSIPIRRGYATDIKNLLDAAGIP